MSFVRMTSLPSPKSQTYSSQSSIGLLGVCPSFETELKLVKYKVSTQVPLLV